MKCPKCGKEMMVESVDHVNKVKRMKCPDEKCGQTEVVDERGGRLLTGDMPPPQSGTLIGG